MTIRLLLIIFLYVCLCSCNSTTHNNNVEIENIDSSCSINHISIQQEDSIPFARLNVWLIDSLDVYRKVLKHSNPNLIILEETVDSFGVTIALQLQTAVQKRQYTDSLVADMCRVFEFSEVMPPEHFDMNLQAIIYIFPEANSINKEMEVLRLEIRPKSVLEYYLVSICKTSITGIDTISLIR